MNVKNRTLLVSKIARGVRRLICLINLALGRDRCEKVIHHPQPQFNFSSHNFYEESSLSPRGINDLIFSLRIPEPTMSLLWIMNEDPSKARSPWTYRISSKPLEPYEDEDNLYAEPSLIWTRLPIQPSDQKLQSPIYYPTYVDLDPEQRWEYLNWLRDVTKPTNLTYVFLYYYGLERHLLLGNYDLAVDEILRLIKHHDKGTLKRYAIDGLILASGYRKRPDILKKAPLVLKELSDDFSALSLYFQKIIGMPISAKKIVNIINPMRLYDKEYKKYLWRYPDLFKEELQKVLNNYQKKHGDILQGLTISNMPHDGWAMMANTSMPEDIRTVKFPSLFTHPTLQSITKQLIEQTNLRIREIKSRKNVKKVNMIF